MRRRPILTASLILAFGAAVNVAVAWGCAAWHYAGGAPRVASMERHEPGVTWRVASYSTPGARRIHSLWGPIDGRDPEVPSPLELAGGWAALLFPDSDGDPDQGGARVVDLRGWPMRSMWSVAEVDLDARRGTGLRLDEHRVRFGVELSDYRRWTRDQTELHRYRILPLGIVWRGFAVNTLLFGAMGACIAAAAVFSRRAIRAGAGRCGRCGYSLVQAAGARCPECGGAFRLRWAGSGGARWVRRGVLIAWAGAAVAAITVAGDLALSGIDAARWNTYKPIWWLAIEGRSADADKAAAAVGELRRRMAGGELEDARIAGLVARALAIQAEPECAWVAAWGDFVVEARDAGLVDDEQWGAFLTHMIAPELAVRPRVAQGNVVPGKLVMHVRAPSAGNFMVHVEKVAATLGGDSRGSRIVSSWPVPSPLGSPIEMPLHSRSRLVADVTPGTHVMHSTWRFRVVEGRTAGMFRGYRSIDLADAEPVTLSAEIDVVPVGESTVQLVDDESLREALRSSIRVHLRRPSPGAIHGTLVHHDPPIDFAFDVFVRWRDQEWPLGSVTSEHTSSWRAPAPTGHSGARPRASREAPSTSFCGPPRRRPRKRWASRASGTVTCSSGMSRWRQRADYRSRRRHVDLPLQAAALVCR